MPIKENGKRTGKFEERVEDPGVADKRLLIVEVELSRHFDVMLRSGNTLSTAVTRHVDAGLTIGVVLPAGARATTVELNGRSVPFRVVTTARGSEVLAVRLGGREAVWAAPRGPAA